MLLVAINLVASPQPIWFVWPLMGWGIGLLEHAFLVYRSPAGSAFKQKLVEKELASLEKAEGSTALK